MTVAAPSRTPTSLPKDRGSMLSRPIPTPAASNAVVPCKRNLGIVLNVEAGYKRGQGDATEMSIAVYQVVRKVYYESG